jgi:hypothetical protein
MKKFLIILAAVVVMLGLGLYLSNQDTKVVATNDFTSVPSDSQLLKNLNKAGLASLSSEGTAFHIHQHLDIVINDKSINIPEHIGVGASFISPLHIHDTSNVIHLESPVKADFKLGQFFDEWGIDFNNQCIATNCVNDKTKLMVFVNGQQKDNFRDLILGSHDEIYIWYGAKDKTPQPIKEYSFPKGY